MSNVLNRAARHFLGESLLLCGIVLAAAATLGVVHASTPHWGALAVIGIACAILCVCGVLVLRWHPR